MEVIPIQRKLSLRAKLVSDCLVVFLVELHGQLLPARADFSFTGKQPSAS